jgi:hypothetical protein
LIFLQSIYSWTASFNFFVKNFYDDDMYRCQSVTLQYYLQLVLLPSMVDVKNSYDDDMYRCKKAPKPTLISPKKNVLIIPQSSTYSSTASFNFFVKNFYDDDMYRCYWTTFCLLSIFSTELVLLPSI